jgi:hypothetical protein
MTAVVTVHGPPLVVVGQVLPAAAEDTVLTRLVPPASGSSTAAKATALSYNGKTWRAQNVPGPGTGKSSYLFGVNCLRANECEAIGEMVASDPATATPLGGQWIRSTWRLVAA